MLILTHLFSLCCKCLLVLPRRKPADGGPDPGRGLTRIYISRIAAVLILFSVFSSHSKAQTNPDSLPVRMDVCEAPQMDMIDLLKFLLHIKSRPRDSVPRHRRAYFAVIPAVGYTIDTKFLLTGTANVSFFMGRGRDANISTIQLNTNYSIQHQLSMPFIVNLWTPGNRMNIQADWRFMKYPSHTYGLGTSAQRAEGYIVDYHYLRMNQLVLFKLAKDFMGGFGYDYDYHWGMKEYKNDGVTETDFDRYGFSTQSHSSGITGTLLYDSRRNANNPLPGYYGNITYRNNQTFLGSDNNWQSLVVDLRKYIQFPARSNNILAFWSYNWFTFSGHAPYLDLPSTGWDTYSSTGRGYAQGRYRGQNMVYLETEYRFPLMKSGLFGGVVFANAQSFTEYPSNKFEYIRPAAGVGLRIKANKHSNTNFSVDYGVGYHSSGFFFNVGELF